MVENNKTLIVCVVSPFLVNTPAYQDPLEYHGAVWTGVVTVPYHVLHEVKHTDPVHGGALQLHHGGLQLQLTPVRAREREELHAVDGLGPLLPFHPSVAAHQQPVLLQQSLSDRSEQKFGQHFFFGESGEREMIMNIFLGMNTTDK